MLDLITDRTGGYYNISDLNRVGDAIVYIRDILAAHAVVIEVNPKRDWTVFDFPTPANAGKYLADVQAIRGAISVPPTTPQLPPDMEQFTYIEANDIEKILLDIEMLINNMVAAWYYSGELYAGEV